MKLPDFNVLVYSVNLDAPQQAAAARWLEGSFDSDEGVALTWTALLGFVRLCTRRGILARPLGVEQALETINYWLSRPSSRVIDPGRRHAALLGRLLLGAGTAGNLTTDAHLAALAMEHGATLGSFDRDFERYPGLSFEHLSV